MCACDNRRAYVCVDQNMYNAQIITWMKNNLHSNPLGYLIVYRK